MKVTAEVVAERAALVWALRSALYSAKRCEDWPDQPCLASGRNLTAPCLPCSLRKALIRRLRTASRRLNAAARSYGLKSRPALPDTVMAHAEQDAEKIHKGEA